MENEITVYILTNPKLGWDCIIGVYQTNEEAEEVAKNYADEDINWKDYLVIHEKQLKIK